MTRGQKIGSLLIAAALLGGCQSIFGRQAAKLEVKPLGEDAAAGSAQASLEQGRQRLMNGEVAAAIAAFRTAARDPGQSAAAYNGLGVAYALIGRGELAERYFRKAVSEAPNVERYAANLARFYRSREAMLARRSAEPSRRQRVAWQDDAMPGRAAFNAEFDRAFGTSDEGGLIISLASSAGLTRVSPTEVMLRTQPPPVPGSRTGPARSARNSTQPAYPVRIEIPERSAH